MHSYDYKCGVIDAFNEVVKAGVKDLALSHPDDLDTIKSLLPFVEEITKKYNTKYRIEEDLLITDLFPYSANKNKTVYLFYQNDEIIKQYLLLKKQKEEAIKNHTYMLIREDIAYKFGKLLSYSDESIFEYIKNNKEKEIYE